MGFLKNTNPYTCIHSKLGRRQSSTRKVIASVDQYVIGNTKKVYIGNTALKVKLQPYWERNCLCPGGFPIFCVFALK